MSPFLSGVITNLSNPKVIFYFASVFANFNFAQMQWMVLVLVLETIVYFSLVALLFSKAFMMRLYEKNLKLVDYTSACIFFAFVVFILIQNCLLMINQGN
ncbi:hypothetical protein A0068_05685 [Campylobacter lari]|uniref:Transporter, LysE family n=1 Tax=Campylobacter subantarcticus TaxID=497724 RepID=A0ABW9N418_9BACT|nr:LysE family transporter [Campylobacter subantarcticus]EAJ1260930.1 hypothetical protein [Campylobacter lari]EAL3939158.1 hypothetical protein [Campylobacter lari]MPB98994.1 hypothetical protein [Campylobacter subantarcticus]